MAATLTAVYRGGAFHPTNPPDLADGTSVTLTVAADPPPADGPHPYDILSAITRRSARPAPAETVSPPKRQLTTAEWLALAAAHQERLRAEGVAEHDSTPDIAADRRRDG